MNEKRKNTPAIVGFVLDFLLFAVCVAGVSGFLYYRYTKTHQVKTESRSALVSRTIEQCQELTVIKERYSDIITLKKTRMFGMAKSYSLVRYTGIVRAGIASMSDAVVVLSEDEKSVTVTLPKAQILGNDIEKQEVFDESQNVFVPISTQEVFDSIDKNREDTVSDLIEEGLLTDAQSRAVEVVKGYLSLLGFENVTVTAAQK